MKYTIEMNIKDEKVTVFIKNKKDLKEFLERATSEQLQNMKIKKY